MTKIEKLYKNYNLMSVGSFKERYCLIKLILTKENMLNLKNEINKKPMERKIEQWLAQWGDIVGIQSLAEAKIKLLEDDDSARVLKTIFSVNPVKQNIGEQMVNYEFKLKKLEFNKPNGMGVGAVYLSPNGNIISGISAKTNLGQRSVDFIVKKGEYTFYISQKYTSGCGGAQNNQCDCLVSHLQSGANNSNEKYIFIGLADGDYYTEKRLSKVEDYEVKNKCKICSMDNIYEYMNSIAGI